ncbi:MAG: MFS transporter [Pseudomonadota bacterium]
MSAFANRQFSLFFAGVFFSVQAIWMQRMALGWLAWDETGSTAFVGLAAGLGLLPALVAGPFFGVMADRIDIRRAAQVISVLMALALLALVLALPVLSPTAILLAALVIGVINAAHQPVRMSLGPRLVPHDLVASLVTATAINFNLARILAPAITAAVIAGFGVAPALWLAIACHLPMFAVLLRLRARPLPDRTPQTLWSDLVEGLRYALATPSVRMALALTLVFATLARGALEILPALADGVYGRGAAGLGALTAAAGIGALASAFLRGARARNIDGTVPRSVYIASALSLLGLIGMGLAPSFEMAFAATVLTGGGATWCGVTLQATIQTGLPDALRGRVMSLWTTLGFGMVAVGAFAIGGLGQQIGLPTGLILAGAVGLVGQALIMRWLAPKSSAA